MKSVGIADLKNHLSEHLRAVERGSSVEVRDRDRPIARIVPAAPGIAPLQIVPAKRPFAAVRDRRHPPAGWPMSSLDLLREERGAR